MRLRFLVLVVALMLTAVSCDFDWLMFRVGPDRTGFSPDTSISKDAVQSSMVLNWTGTTSAGVSSSPAVAKGVLYVGSSGLLAFDAAGSTNCSGSPKDCAPLWTGTTGSFVSSSPAVDNGVVYVGSQDDKLYAFDAAGTTNCSGSPKSCAPLWTATTGGDVLSSPAVTNGVVYVGSQDGKLYAFDAAGTTNCSGSPKTCGPLWSTDDGGFAYSSPAVTNGVLYVGGSDGLYAFDAAGTTNCSGSPKTCVPLWTGTTGDLVDASPAVANGLVYVLTRGHDSEDPVESSLYAFDAVGDTNCSGSPKTCAPLWTAGTAGRDESSSPAVANGVVYASSADRLYAFDAVGATNCSGSPTTCAPLWTATGVGGSPAVANGVLYVVLSTAGNAVSAFDAAGTTNCSGSPKTCTPLWTGTTGSSVGSSSSPAVSHGMVYVGSNDHKLYAFGLERIPPTTSILIPANEAALSGTAILDASASDNIKVSRVEFRLTGGSYNNALIGAATLTYYGWISSWDTTTVPNGPYTLNSVAFDAAGNSSRSPTVNIAVQNYPPPTAKVYLTFDDGPSVYTPQILSELKSGGARATFFVIGEHATQYPSYVQQEQAAGDEIGDHTWDHPDLTTLPPDQIRQELESTAEEIASLTGTRPTLWRAPYSLWNATVNEIALSLGLTRVGADVNSRDYLEPGTDAIISAVLDNVHDGSVVQLHDGSPDDSEDRSQTVAALPVIIDTLRKRGYGCATLDTTTSAQASLNDVVTGE